jgi:hypothetical protein
MVEEMDQQDPSHSGLLTRLSASPKSSSSSFTSSSSFDPHAHPSDEKDGSGSGPGPATLGLRELARMRKEERRAKKEATNPQVDTVTSTGIRTGTGAQVDKRREVKLVASVIGAGSELPFATDVVIRGWKVVGGRSWTDIGRIGAYVGTSNDHSPLCVDHHVIEGDKDGADYVRSI